MKSVSSLLALVVSLLAGFIMTMILVAGSLVLFDQAFAVATRIYRFLKRPVVKYVNRLRDLWHIRCVRKYGMVADLGAAGVVIGPQ